MDQQLQEFEERLNKQLDTRFEKIDQRFDAADQRARTLEATVKAGFEEVATHFTQTDARIEAVNHRVGVLHEHAMANFKISLEALQGARESISRQIDERTKSIEGNIELVSKAVRANQAESLADRARK